MAIPKITYADKVDYQQQGQENKYKITAKDMNEIKNTFNKSVDAINQVVQLQSQLETAIAQCGNYKIENGKIYFRNAKGTYGEGIQLPAQSSVFFNNAVLGTLNIDSVPFIIAEGEGYIEVGNYEEYLKSLGK